ncbi:unnamed protein product [Cuscuta europaea]|uniref:Uncharacterized protein n=1 Tax=Cuscuta europaea TaxID=41803 RepID=A0A9P0ZVT0_CUSEU|nr:unnamed protein product [Cuscuta europaea]
MMSQACAWMVMRSSSSVEAARLPRSTCSSHNQAPIPRTKADSHINFTEYCIPLLRPWLFHSVRRPLTAHLVVVSAAVIQNHQLIVFLTSVGVYALIILKSMNYPPKPLDS